MAAMNRFPAVIFVAITIVLATAGSAAAGLQDALERKALIVAMPAEDIFPYCYKSPDGSLVGSDVDMAKDVAQRLSVDFRPDRSAASVYEVIGKLTRNEADLGISGIKVLLPHLALTAMSRPYLKLRYTLIVNRLSLAALGGKGDPSEIFKNTSCKRIGALDKTGYAEHVLALFPGSKVIPYKRIEDMIRDTISGKVPVSFCDELEARSAFMRSPVLGVPIQLEFLNRTRDEVALAVSWKDRRFKNWLNLYINSRPADLDVDGLLEKYPLP